jgi:hypothetical protein
VARKVAAPEEGYVGFDEAQLLAVQEKKIPVLERVVLVPVPLVL